MVKSSEKAFFFIIGLLLVTITPLTVSEDEGWLYLLRGRWMGSGAWGRCGRGVTGSVVLSC